MNRIIAPLVAVALLISAVIGASIQSAQDQRADITVATCQQFADHNVPAFTATGICIDRAGHIVPVKP